MQTVSTADYRPRALNIGTSLFCCLLLCAVAFKALASDPHPLAPPDRSSPRATLQSFITHMDAAQRAYTSGTDGADVARAFRQAIDCLDLSKVAPTLHCDVGGYSALLLKEILDRLDLPTADAISGSDTDQAHWTIPQTEIAVVRMKEGELAGQYLFSQRTLERFQEFYDHARQLPEFAGFMPSPMHLEKRH